MTFPVNSAQGAYQAQNQYQQPQAAQRQQKPNSGTLWINDRKAKPNDPDFTGKADINGVEHYISGWSNTTATGKQNIRISFKVADQARPAQQQAPVQRGGMPF